MNLSRECGRLALKRILPELAGTAAEASVPYFKADTHVSCRARRAAMVGSDASAVHQ